MLIGIIAEKTLYGFDSYGYDRVNVIFDLVSLLMIIGIGILAYIHIFIGVVPETDSVTIAQTSNEESKMEEKKDKKIFLSPAGAIIALICFFLPWVRFSCMGKTKYASGADLGGMFWVVFAAAIFIVLIFFVFQTRKELAKSKPFILIASLAALVIILIQYIRFSSGELTEFGRIRPQDIGLTIQFGGIGTVIGFILSFIGSFFLNKKNTNKELISKDG